MFLLYVGGSLSRSHGASIDVVDSGETGPRWFAEFVGCADSFHSISLRAADDDVSNLCRQGITGACFGLLSLLLTATDSAPSAKYLVGVRVVCYRTKRLRVVCY